MPTVKTDMLEYISIILPKSAILTTANTVVVGDVALEPRYKTIHYVSSSLSSMNIYTNTLKVLDYETYRANTALSP
jgi:hypothetical protein